MSHRSGAVPIAEPGAYAALALHPVLDDEYALDEG
jgi:hypothetical protein